MLGSKDKRQKPGMDTIPSQKTPLYSQKYYQYEHFYVPFIVPRRPEHSARNLGLLLTRIPRD
jgi:hypothetical protein